MPSRRPNQGLPVSVTRQMIEDQHYRCIYCMKIFGTLVRKRSGQTRWISPEVDHFIPYAYVGTNEPGNLVMSCGVCNRIKTADIYDDIDEAREAIQQTWHDQGIMIEWEPAVSSEQDPDEWTREYSAWLVKE